MFELWYWFWNELNKLVSSGDFWEAYINMGNIFWFVIIVSTTSYAIFVIRPIARYQRWKHKKEG